MVIAYGVCIGSWDRFMANVAPRIAGPLLGPLVGLFGQTSIADAYNAILDHYTPNPPDLLILQHDDLEITDPQAVEKLGAAARPDVALLGVAGARGVKTLAWWNYETVGHQQTDAGPINFPGGRTGDVDALEGSLLVFTPWAVANLRFDSLPGFHGYDVLICAKAIDAGMRVVVADVDTHHHTTPGLFKSQASHADWLAADERFRERAQS